MYFGLPFCCRKKNFASNMQRKYYLVQGTGKTATLFPEPAGAAPWCLGPTDDEEKRFRMLQSLLSSKHENVQAPVLQRIGAQSVLESWVMSFSSWRIDGSDAEVLQVKKENVPQSSLAKDMYGAAVDLMLDLYDLMAFDVRCKYASFAIQFQWAGVIDYTRMFLSAEHVLECISSDKISPVTALAVLHAFFLRCAEKTGTVTAEDKMQRAPVYTFNSNGSHGYVRCFARDDAGHTVSRTFGVMIACSAQPYTTVAADALLVLVAALKSGAEGFQ